MHVIPSSKIEAHFISDVPVGAVASMAFVAVAAFYVLNLYEIRFASKASFDLAFHVRFTLIFFSLQFLAIIFQFCINHQESTLLIRSRTCVR